MTREKLAQIRRVEQRAACATLGVSEIEFLDYDDGQLQPTLDLRRDLVRALRQYQPEVVLTNDPTALFLGDQYINHPDHRAAAQAAIEGRTVYGHAGLAIASAENVMNAWFIGFVRDGEEAYAVAVLLEDVSDAELAAEVGGLALRAALEQAD